MQQPTAAEKRSGWNKTGLLYLLVVYIVWGSTYLAIRVAVRDGAGFTPFMLGAFRALTAGAILLAAARLSGHRLKLARAEFVTLAALGALFWVFGNGFVMIGEQRADSGTAALIIAGVPVWAAVISSIWDRRLPSLLQVLSLLLGTGGIILLSMPSIQTGLRADLLAVAALVFASISWAGGTVLQSRRHPDLAPAVNSGYQMLFGGIGFVLMALLTGEPLPHPQLPAWLAWGYLVIFGSLLGFTSYLQALRLLPTPVVTTYGYVNPVIAVFLGWLILHEQVSHWTLFGAALILLGIWVAFHDQRRAALARRMVVEMAPGGED